MVIANFLAMVLMLAAPQGGIQSSDARKQEFIDLLKTLPTKGEFYTDEAITKTAPYLPVLLSLTEKDLEKYDLYPFADISRGLCDRREHRQYAVHNFSKIAHPTLKLFWAAMLFDSTERSSEITQFLRGALASKVQSKLLSEMLGPKFEDFKKRVLSN